MTTLPRNPPPAGRSTIQPPDEGTRFAMAWEARPDTPPEVKKWRTDYEPGKRVRAPALKDDVVDNTRAFGSTSLGSDHVEDVMNAERKTGFQEFMAERAEARMVGALKKEPIGKSSLLGEHLPDHVRAPDYAFGVTTRLSDSAKGLIYPDAPEEEKEAPTCALHGVANEGEQRRRNYDWSKTKVGSDPRLYRFGTAAPKPPVGSSGVSLAMNPDDDDDAPRVVVVPKRVADAAAARADRLGKTHSLGVPKKTKIGADGKEEVDEDVTYGAAAAGADEWGAGDCIRGDYSIGDQLPDRDLGRSVAKGYRNFSHDPERVFGVPTVRADVPKPAKRSVSDNQNYGDDTSAQSLLQPSRFAVVGVDHKDFVETRGPEEIRDIFEKIGVRLDDHEFAQVWRRAATHYDLNEDGIVSIEEFRLALNEYDDAREEGRIPDWFEEEA